MKQLAIAFLLLSLPLWASARPKPASGYEERLRTAVLAGNQDQVVSICREWYHSGQCSAGMLNWNYNALMSVEQGSLLLTQNDHDTYPAMLLQFALDVRQDVSVLNVGLLENDQYRKLCIDRNQLTWIPAGTSLLEFVRRLQQQQAQSTPVKPLYFSVMLDKSRFETEPRNLYVTGLALKFSAQPFDNLTVLKSNYENLFRTDYLKLDFQQDHDAETVATMNMNYIPALMLLYRNYSTSGQVEKAAALKDLALKIGRAGNQTTAVESLFPGTTTAETPLVSAISPKLLEKSMMKVTDRLYAAETELTNGQYEQFLEDLVKNKNFDQLAQCKTAKTNWRALLPKAYQQVPDAELYKNGNPDGDEFPVQNVSWDAAQRYCEWITQVYNNYPGKKKFKKVIFRLPTAAEWEQAAAGGLKQISYPWGGYYVQNSKGCFLCNLRNVEACKDCPEKSEFVEDGGFFPVKANSYFPNRFGLYNMSGNVAEMVQERGKSKGGSWADTAFECQIVHVKEYDAPSPTLGFRVFMEVIEP
jgi:formylglycine-generating enzyme required for sulfatase activity